MVNWIRNIWRTALHWVEAGDLILPLIIISVAHYAAVLERKDLWFVAFAIGVLIDLASYRLVKAAIKFGGWFWFEALVMSMFAFAFHLEFYVGSGGWFYPMAAAAIPVCLVFLASLSVRERWEQKSKPREMPSANLVPMAQTGAPMAMRGTYDSFAKVQASRNGNGSLSVAEVVAQFGVPRRTAYNWLAKHREAVEKK